jgi:hypothetical protein
MKGFILILSVVLNSGDNVGGGALEVVPVVYTSLADCQRDAQAFIDADGGWPNHRAVCVGRNGTVAALKL